MNEACLLSLAYDLRAPQVKEGSSNSIIVFGKWQSQDVVFKITTESKPRENALEIERDVYMYIKNVISLQTPHFASGISIGNCNVQDIIESKNDFLKNVLTKKWKIFRGAAIYPKLNIYAQRSIMTRFKTENPQADLWEPDVYESQFFEFVHDIIENPREESMHYIMTEKMQGVSLQKFFESNANEIKSNPFFEFIISVQIAQALCVAESKEFMHNDLHLGNIFIRKRKDTNKPLEYTYPFKFNLDTQYFLTIFDYDFSWYKGGKDNTSLTNTYCASHGTCSKYTKNYDWYFYLHNLILYMKSIRDTRLSTLIEDPLHGESFGNKGQYVTSGRPCICTDEDLNQNENTQDRCIGICQMDTKTLDEFITPELFLRSNSISLPQMTVVQPKKDVIHMPQPRKLISQQVADKEDTLTDPAELFKDYDGPNDMGKKLDWLQQKQTRQAAAKRKRNVPKTVTKE